MKKNSDRCSRRRFRTAKTLSPLLWIVFLSFSAPGFSQENIDEEGGLTLPTVLIEDTGKEQGVGRDESADFTNLAGPDLTRELDPGYLEPQELGVICRLAEARRSWETA